MSSVINLKAKFNDNLPVVFNLCSSIRKSDDSVEDYSTQSSLTDYCLPSATTPQHWFVALMIPFVAHDSIQKTLL